MGTMIGLIKYSILFYSILFYSILFYSYFYNAIPKLIIFFFNNNIFLFKMLVAFLLQKPKLLMKYLILIFSYIIKILSNNII
jgi:hypothetical protein